MKHPPSPFPRQPLMHKLAFYAGLFGVILLFLFSSLAAAPLSPIPQQTATPQPVQLTPQTPSALPAEYYQTEEQSTTILVGAVVLVLIVSISATSVLFRRKRRQKK